MITWLYRLGVISGIIVLYVFSTIVGASIVNFMVDEEDNEFLVLLVAYILGGIAFFTLSIYTIVKLGLWG